MGIKDLKKGARLYFLGIGGVSMSAIATRLSARGYTVAGYDRASSPATDALREKGIDVSFDFDPAVLSAFDAVVYSAAFGSDHPVMKQTAATGIPLISRAEMLGHVAEHHANSVAVAGTHGKSTASGMLGHIFLNASGCDPTVIVGATMRDVNSAYRIGSDENFIYEACEYKDSFLSFFPHASVVLNISLDHTDYFKSMEQLCSSFTRFMNNCDESGYALYNLDCENCIRAADGVTRQKITFSAAGNEKADYRAENITERKGLYEYDLFRGNEFIVHISLSVPGAHNVSDSLAAAAVCDISGISPQDIASGIKSFYGVGRRFERVGEANGAAVYDDYAHHPDEIKATLAAARQLAGAAGRVICVFQPHNYSRLHDLYAEFTKAFADADKLYLCPLYAARGTCGSDVSSETLARDTGGIYCDSFEKAKKAVMSSAHSGDIVMIMGAGDIYRLSESFM